MNLDVQQLDGVIDLIVEALLREIMQLYGAETRALSRSVRIPSLFNLARDSISDTVNSVMTGVAADLAGELARQVYRRAL